MKTISFSVLVTIAKYIAETVIIDMIFYSLFSRDWNEKIIISDYMSSLDFFTLCFAKYRGDCIWQETNYFFSDNVHDELTGFFVIDIASFIDNLKNNRLRDTSESSPLSHIL